MKHLFAKYRFVSKVSFLTGQSALVLFCFELLLSFSTDAYPILVLVPKARFWTRLALALILEALFLGVHHARARKSKLYFRLLRSEQKRAIIIEALHSGTFISDVEKTIYTEHVKSCRFTVISLCLGLLAQCIGVITSMLVGVKCRFPICLATSLSVIAIASFFLSDDLIRNEVAVIDDNLEAINQERRTQGRSLLRMPSTTPYLDEIIAVFLKHSKIVDCNPDNAADDESNEPNIKAEANASETIGEVQQDAQINFVDIDERILHAFMLYAVYIILIIASVFIGAISL